MNSGIGQAILAVGGSWMLSTLAKATFAAALGLCAAEVAGRKRAAFRHAVLAATFGVLLALPVVSAVAPPVSIAVSGTHAAASVRPLPGSGGASGTIAARGGSVTGPEASRWSPGELLTAGWIAGIAVFLLPAGAGLAQVLRLRRSGLPWQEGQPIVDRLAAGAGVRRRVDVLLHEALDGPMACGLARPAVVLPVDAPGWGREDLDRALIHELEHVSRQDWAVQCAARAVCALYWFHPLVWMALRRLELEAERACDDAVLERSEATAYADQLVAAARRISAAKSPLVAMAGRADLASRVSAVLDGGQRRGRAGVWRVAGVAAASAALAVAVSPLRMVAAPQPQEGRAAVARLRVDTRLVVTEVKVSYPNGKPVEGLGASDFAVTENGAPQIIQICEYRKEDAADPNSGVYTIGYYSGPSRADGQFRKIQVTVRTATVAKVEHRDGYVLTDGAGFAQSSVAPSPAGAGVAPAYDKAPVLIFKVEPEFTEAARKAKYQGTALLDIDVDEAGKPVNIGVARSLGLGLDEKAIEAVKQWRFKAATKDGKPVEAKAQVEVNFRLL